MAESFLIMYEMTFLHTFFHFVRLLLLKNSVLDAIMYPNFKDQIMDQVMESANQISKSIHSYLVHNPQLQNLTLLMKYIVVFTGAIHCALSSVKPADLKFLADYIKFLEILGQTHPQCLFDAKNLVEWNSTPGGAIAFLQEKFY
jgi:hypothetical protein